ncbi:MAG TPA: hypothetical protein VFL17_19340 [Anaerolineae bacterium]|nr:hypothetical protein [Anaerolineae bacterium]
MSKSRIFHTGRYKAIQKAIVKLLNSQPDFVSTRTAASTRAVGDAIQTILSERFQSLLGELCAEYSADFARRAMADLAFTDRDGLYHVVDVKTHRLGTQFNMPNLTSVERLARFYEGDENYFVCVVREIRYRRDEGQDRTGAFCSDRVSLLGLPDDWSAGMGTDTDSQRECYQYQRRLFSQEMDD